MRFLGALTAIAASLSLTAATQNSETASFVNQTTCNGKTYTYEQLAGYGFIASNARDKFGDTLGGFGSSIALESKSWKKKGGVYTGIIWALPDRGWNTQGTLNFQSRVHKFALTLTPAPDATLANPSSPNLQLRYLDTIRFTGPDGTPCTGLDPDVTGSISYPGFPQLPVATFQGDGFGGAGPGGRRIPVDSEGLVLGSDGSFWVSDEYGPYIYKFSPRGRMTLAIRPPEAYIPRRNNTVSFSANSPPFYNPNQTVTPGDPTTGRNNNQGLEGLTISDDGRTLYALMQSALNQEGGPNNPNRLNTRLIEYDVSGHEPRYINEYVVTLPLFRSGNSSRVAAQSEIHYLSSTQFLILSRDSGAGHGQSSSTSLYRQADIFDISRATDIKSPVNDAANGSIASRTGVLKPGLRAAEYCSFLDFNVNSELGRFGLHNGGPQDQFLLNEKWESLALAPVNPGNNKDGEYFLFSVSDNDFITQDGYMNGGNFTYSDESGYNLDNQALVFKIKAPKGVKLS